MKWETKPLEGFATASRVLIQKMTSVETPKNWSLKLIQSINQANPAYLILGLLCLNFLSFVPKHNEEQYLLYARQFFNPDWISGSLMATEFPGTRLLFEILFGWFVEFLGFEKAIFFGRLLNFILLAFPLAAIFKELKFSNIQVFLILQIYFLTNQTFFAGEWIFGALEAKTFAYVFVFWGLYKFLKKEYYWALGSVIIATYFHILIGGWFAVSCFLVLLIKLITVTPKGNHYMNWKKFFKLGFFYGIPMLPLLYYLAINIFAETPNYEDNVNLDYVYIYFRNKHHAGLFYTFEFFFQKHFIGVLSAFLVFLIFLKLKVEDSLKTIQTLMLVMLGIGLFFVGVCLMDNLFFDLSGGFMLKSYPFRMQGLAFLFFIILSVHFISKKYLEGLQPFQKSGTWNKVLPFLLIIGIIAAFGKLGFNIQKMATYQHDLAYNEALSFIKSETPDPSLILALEGNNSNKKGHRNNFAIDLMRRTERDIFVHFKFVPATPNKMHEWYQRILLMDKLEENPALIQQVKEDYDVDYVLVKKGLKIDLEVVFENEEYQIFK